MRIPLLLTFCVFLSPTSSLAADLPLEAGVCAGCHGEQGQGINNLGPRLAGLPAQYLERQVNLFKGGSRQNVTMHAMAMGIGGEQLQKVANYFSAQPVQPVAPVRRGEQTAYTDPAAKLVYQGDWSRTLPACATCHGPATIGVGQIPRLAGQQADYLKNQLVAWQQGKRAGDPDNTMGNIAGKLSGAEIDALSSYLANLQ
ncbi:c-type cytochrome [Microbulbifer hainanensis]|uniref:c-type cytochrome n=1 Tax=Microbulbifer hainanensis TaxID=2735675 RepID=UPI001865EB3D|nr:c-type cytochrome [Microbulbifer hainanensis]